MANASLTHLSDAEIIANLWLELSEAYEDLGVDPAECKHDMICWTGPTDTVSSTPDELLSEAVKRSGLRVTVCDDTVIMQAPL